MNIDDLKERVNHWENEASAFYDKFEAADNVASELSDIVDEWEGDEEISDPDIGDFAPNQIEDFHFACLAYGEAQERIAGYPDAIENILERVSGPSDQEGGNDG